MLKVNLKCYFGSLEKKNVFIEIEKLSGRNAGNFTNKQGGLREPGAFLSFVALFQSFFSKKSNKPLICFICFILFEHIINQVFQNKLKN